ncbi:MAG TPA: type II toxin-antitoxin system RelB/DinJ family antitoxin [Bacillota bacterium]|nr:type II toxin-antitoxin system RelB/DinJ family antitoxin [Bacillota bacterium]HPJ23933.1 type II toxin-antitoxin system RelB/DinJ family antitoxin [Bacillota bacterium]
MAKTGYINVRVDQEVKIKAEEILEELGINASTAIDMYLKQIILKDGLPFEVVKPKHDFLSRQAELTEAVKQYGVKTISGQIKKIIGIYANGDIDFDVALYAIRLCV